MRPLADAKAASAYSYETLPADESRYGNMLDSKIEELATGYPELNWWAARFANAAENGYMTPLEAYVHLHVAQRNLIAGRLCAQLSEVVLEEVTQS